ncbi:hypothetical protein [Pedobacter sp.]
MMMRKTFFFAVCGFLTVLISCKEFIEPSLENKTLNAIAPADGVETNSYQLTFWWELDSDALRYRLQVAYPSFASAQKMILDTLVKSDKFVYTLDPGNYQWRIRAENGSSRTAYVTKSFTVHPSSLSDQTLQVTSPVGQIFTNNSVIPVQWLKLYGATGYRLQIDKNNFLNENNLTLNAVTDNLSYQYMLPQEGSYQLRVRAENTNESSKWSTVRNIVYDATPPVQVILNTPANGQTVSKPISLSWSAVNDAVQYELGLYKSDMVTPYNSSFPQVVSNNSSLLTVGESGEALSWRVRAVDRAGNKGSWSNFFTFNIQ